MQSHLPSHVAIIMDGNGRWARARNLPRTEGHIAGVQTVKRIVKACLEQGISILSLFAFSSENWGRPEEEVSCIMRLFLEALQHEIQELNTNQVSLRFTGNLTQLSPTLQDHIAQAQALTQNNNQLILNVVINYGGKWDIVHATKTLLQKILNNEMTLEQLNEESFSACLATGTLPHPDLFIRTSGEQRISNFFLWQLAYAELYFTPVFWPDFTEKELIEALNDFHQRQRRFGRVTNSEQDI